MASESNKAIAQAVADAFKVRPKVMSYKDDNNKSETYIATSIDCPTPGINSYSTLALSDYPLIKDGAEYSVRLEILFACANDIDYWGNVIATAAFFIINDKWFCGPGVVYQDMVKMYDPKAKLQHLYFTTPFLWGGKPQTMHLPDKTVAFLQAILISESERLYLAEHGSDDFESLLQSKDVDIANYKREPVV